MFSVFFRLLFSLPLGATKKKVALRTNQKGKEMLSLFSLAIFVASRGNKKQKIALRTNKKGNEMFSLFENSKIPPLPDSNVHPAFYSPKTVVAGFRRALRV